MGTVRLAASILNADFGHLADQIGQAETAGVDLIHVDVMDGQFVPNLTLGFAIVEAIRRNTSLPLDVHLMIDRPERYLADFARAGANILTLHHEAVIHLDRAIRDVKTLGLQAGVALCPATPLGAIEEVVADLDLLLVMTINPGIGGQVLIPSTLDKVRRARKLLDRRASVAALEVDGGVKAHNAADLVAAGADTLVVGTGIFRPDLAIQPAVAEIREAIGAS